MKKQSWFIRMGLFTLMMLLGTGIALVVGETTGLALSELPNTPIEILTTPPDNNGLYIVLSGEKPGIYHSDNSGRIWQQISTRPNHKITALAVHPSNEQVIYAGIKTKTPSGSSLWYSNNSGQTWNLYPVTLPTNAEGRSPAISALTVDPNHPGVLYVGTEGQGIYKVQSGYAGFDLIGDAKIQNLFIKDIVAEPNSPVYAISTEGLVAVEGENWQKIASLPDGPVSLAINPQNTQKLYVGTVGYGVVRSTDGGQTWHPLNKGLGWQPGMILRVPAIAIDQDNPEHLAIATAYSVGSHLIGDGIYESFNGGEHWVKIANRQDAVKDLSIKNGGIYIATSDGLVRYGNPMLTPLSQSIWSQLISLINPSKLQILVFALTIVLAGWVLIVYPKRI